jgi:hypothetical protein
MFVDMFSVIIANLKSEIIINSEYAYEAGKATIFQRERANK